MTAGSRPATLALDGRSIPLETHPLRDASLGEIHARPFHRLQSPRRILHFAFQLSNDQVGRDKEAMTALCTRRMAAQPDPASAYHRIMQPDFNLRWEQHSEFTTQSWDFPVADRTTKKSADMPIPPGDFWQPGALLVALDVMLVPKRMAKPFIDRLDETSLARSVIGAGEAEILSDFKMNAQGFTRILVIDNGMEAITAGSLVQRLIEVEVYRTLALLGLPEARRIGPQLRQIELALGSLIDRSRTAEGIGDNRDLLQQLTGLTADLEALSSSVAYRFAASNAYDEIVFQRLETLAEKALTGVPTWVSFLARRMGPARRTLAAMQQRMQDLSLKLTRTTTLLRTRVDVEQEQQNQELLRSMNERTRLQLRLQQTVEGLSVVAISYYLVGLVYYALQGLAKAGWIKDAQLYVAGAVPLVILVVWLMIKRLRKRLGEG
jgi:uncharacterized membrane-anchored protein